MPEPVLVVIAPFMIVSTLPTSTPTARRNGPRKLTAVVRVAVVELMGSNP
jgi:hypothetical protein